MSPLKHLENSALTALSNGLETITFTPNQILDFCRDIESEMDEYESLLDNLDEKERGTQ